MIRFSSLPVCAILTTGLLACGSNTTTSTGSTPDAANGTTVKSALDLVPLDNGVSGWLVDTSTTKTKGARAASASSEAEAVGLIDGSAAPYYRAPYTPKMFLWQNFTNDTMPAAPPPLGAALMLYILEMPSEEQAKGLYAELLNGSGTDYTRLAGTDKDWQPPSPLVGKDSRIQDTGAQWWINFYKGVYYAEVMLFPSYGPEPEYVTSHPDLKKEALRFAQAIASGM